MKAVVDTNILFSFFRKDAFTRTLLVSKKADWCTPAIALVQLRKYKADICIKARISSREFEEILGTLSSFVRVVPLEEYQDALKEARGIAETFTGEERREILDDIDFIALACKEDCALWSNDKLLKRQSKVRVIPTTEMSPHLG
jgi:predicted nucleic acid-binding protein